MLEFLKEYYKIFIGLFLMQVILGYLFTILIQNRFSRHLEAFKTDLQKSLAKANYLYIETAKAANEAYALATILQEQFLDLRKDIEETSEGRLSENNQKLMADAARVMDSNDALAKYMEAHSLYFDKDLLLEVLRLCTYVNENYDTPLNDSTAIDDQVRESGKRLMAIRQSFKKLVVVSD